MNSELDFKIEKVSMNTTRLTVYEEFEGKRSVKHIYEGSRRFIVKTICELSGMRLKRLEFWG